MKDKLVRQKQWGMILVKILLIIATSLIIFMFMGLYYSLNLLFTLRIGAAVITILFSIFMAFALRLIVPKVRTFGFFSIPPGLRIVFNFESREAFVILREITAEIFLNTSEEEIAAKLKETGCLVRFDGLYKYPYTTRGKSLLRVLEEAICKLTYNDESKTFRGKTRFLGTIPDDYGATVLYESKKGETGDVIGSIQKVIHIDPLYVSLQSRQNQWLMALTILILLFTFSMVVFGIAQIILGAGMYP